MDPVDTTSSDEALVHDDLNLKEVLAIFLRTWGHLDGAAFYSFVTAALPSYATPLFARVVSEPDVTGTFKLKKVTLQEEGWDRDRVADELYFRDDTAAAYVPLTPGIVTDIESGNLRI
jgi:fatty-acyl-CoA synthase